MHLANNDGKSGYVSSNVGETKLDTMRQNQSHSSASYFPSFENIKFALQRVFPEQTDKNGRFTESPKWRCSNYIGVFLTICWENLIVQKISFKSVRVRVFRGRIKTRKVYKVYFDVDNI